jgi:hypothetical protein
VSGPKQVIKPWEAGQPDSHDAAEHIAISLMNIGLTRMIEEKPYELVGVITNQNGPNFLDELVYQEKLHS